MQAGNCVAGLWVRLRGTQGREAVHGHFRFPDNAGFFPRLLLRNARRCCIIMWSQ